MRPAWRLAINTLSARRSRTALLVAAVALSAALIVTVSCALASAQAAIQRQMGATVGTADLRVAPATNTDTIAGAVLQAVRAWPEVAEASGWLKADLSLLVEKEYWVHTPAGPKRETRPIGTGSQGNGFSSWTAREIELEEGRLPERDGEVAIDSYLAWRLSGEAVVESGSRSSNIVRGAADFIAPTGEVGVERAVRENRAVRVAVGDELKVTRFGAFRQLGPLRVVGIVKQPPMGGRPHCYLTLDALGRLTGLEGRLSEVAITLRPGHDAGAVAAARAADLGPTLIVQTTAKITSDLDRNVKSSQLGLVLASVLAAMSAAFIILTGLTTSVTERQRELAILRCVGGTRAQVASSQLILGAVVGVAGAIMGIPAGLALVELLAVVFREEMPGGVTLSKLGLVLAAAGAVASGLIGAAYPAWQASRVSPLRALASRGKAPGLRGLCLTLACGLALLAVQALIVTIPRDSQFMFWAYATTGLPGMVIGYFLLGVPGILAASIVLGPLLSRVLGLPRRLLARTVAATPYRHGFTAGALMGGLALMVAIWTNGTAVLRDWLNNIEFPDAFVTGLNLTEESQRRLDAMPFVVRTCAITRHPVETDAFGVRGLQRYKTTFLAFEPDPFFAMTRLTWIQGTPEEAIPRLKEGGAVIVAREFLAAKGLGVGDTFRCGDGGKEFEFAIVGVITSPGLEIVSKFFNIGDEYHQQALHAVFGTRGDLERLFGSRAVHLIQIDLADEREPGGVSDAAAVEAIKRELFDAGIIDAGSGRQVKEEIREFALGLLAVFSVIAGAAMLIACFGVANLIVAGIEARRFEFGVLRAVGGSRGLLTRLVLGEVVLVALTACILGTAMGLQGSWAGQRLDELLLGLSLDVRPPWAAIAAAWGVLGVMSLGSALPAMVRLSRRGPRELLASMRG